MQNPPLQPLHLASALSQAKLNHYARLTTEELIRSLAPGQPGALKTRDLVGELNRFLAEGKNVGIHCRGCIGRSSVIAACVLLNGSKDSEACFETISKTRGVPVPDTLAQREWVGHFARM